MEYPELCQTSKVKFFCKSGWTQLTIFSKISNLYVWQGFKHVSDMVLFKFSTQYPEKYIGNMSLSTKNDHGKEGK